MRSGAGLAKQGQVPGGGRAFEESNKGVRDVQIYEPFGDLVLTFEKSVKLQRMKEAWIWTRRV